MICNGFVKMCDGVWVNKNHAHSFCVEKNEDSSGWSITVITTLPSPKKDPRAWSLQESFTTEKEAQEALDLMICGKEE